MRLPRIRCASTASLRRQMHLAHEPLRAERANGKDGNVNAREARGDLREVRPPTGIAGEVEHRRRTLQHQSAPQRAIAIERAAPGEMLRRDRRHARAVAQRGALPPVQFGHIAHADLVQAARIAQRGKHRRVVRFFEAPQRGQVEMIVVVMAEQHGINRRQVFEADAGRAMAARADPRQRTRRGTTRWDR